MSEEKCEFYRVSTIPDNDFCADKDCLCTDNPNCYYKQLQTAKEENEKLKEGYKDCQFMGKPFSYWLDLDKLAKEQNIENFILENNQKYDKHNIINKQLTQQNKQMREALEEIADVYSEWDEEGIASFCSDIAQQALKGGK